jgi:hypothetical protein
MHKQQLDRIGALENTLVSSMRQLIKYLDGKTSKTEVVNQLKEIGTPDILKVVEAVEKLDSSVKNGKLDISPLVKGLDALEKQLKQLPKSFPEAPEPLDTIKVSNLKDLDIEGLKKAVKGLNLKAPDVNVSAPEVKVDAPDLEPLKKSILTIVDSVKALKFPETDTSQLEKHLDNANKKLQTLIDQPKGGGGGGSGVSFQDSTGKPIRIEAEPDGSVPVTVVAGGGSGGDGAIVDGVSSSIKATVADLANSNPLAVEIVDGSGDQITSFGGGTQYTEGDTDASITGTAAMMEVAANTLQPVQGTVADGLLVNLGSNNDVTVTSGSITETNSAAIKTAVETIDNAISGSEMQVDVVASLPAGTNNIGDVDVVSTTLPTGVSTSSVTSVSDTNSSTTLKAANSARKQIIIQNTSSAVLYIKYGTTASSTDFTVSLSQGDTLIEDRYTGRIDGIWATDPNDGAAKVTEIE